MKVSVIMASYLGNYPNRATNPEKKFIRAVKSFLSQTYNDKELIIVSDGCDKTEQLYNQYFLKETNVKFIKIPKGELYSGDSRNAGFNLATGEIISYLDSDDVIGKKHLEIIMNEFTDDVDLVYYNDYLVRSSDFKQLYKRINSLACGYVGTSSITHRNPKYIKEKYNFDWKWTSGYTHDFIFIMRGVTNGLKFKKLNHPSQYLVTHYGNLSQTGSGDF